MILMPIIMVSPFAALLLFYFFTPSAVLPVYLVVLIVAGFCYYVMFKSMRDSAKTGIEAMIGQEARVIEDIDPEGKIEFKNDIWTATTVGQKIVQGGSVRILYVKGLVLIVEEIEETNNRKSAD